MAGRQWWLKGARSLVLGLLLSLLLVASSQRERIWLYGGGSFTPGESVSLDYYLPEGRSATLTLYKILNPERVLAAGGPQFFESSEALDLEPVTSLTVGKSPTGNYGTAQLGALELGFYFAQLEAGRMSGVAPSATLILVSDLGLVSKTDATQVLAYTADLVSGEPREAQVFLMTQTPGGRLEANSDASGLASFSASNGGNYLLAARSGEAWAFSDAYWNRWNVRRAMVYTHSDRPVYRPGQSVYFKATARAASGLGPLAGETVEVVVRAADGSDIYLESLTADDFGSVDGELVLGLEPPLGRYTIQARARGEVSYASFEVQAYVKPEYRVTVTTNEGVAVQGDTVRFTVGADYLFGGPVAGGAVAYTVLKEPYHRFGYRSSYAFYEDHAYSLYGGSLLARGQGVLDENGELVIELALPKDEGDYRLTLQAGVSDEARRELYGASSLIAYRSSVVLNVSTDRYAYREGEEIRLRVEARDLRGNPVSAPFSVRGERHYWRGSGSSSVAFTVQEGQTDAGGMATVLVPALEQGSYTLTISAQDDQGRETRAQAYAWVSGSASWYWRYERLSVQADKPEYEVGDTARFVIESPVPDARVLLTREGQALGHVEVIQLAGSTLLYELPITADMAPNAYLGVSLMGGGQIYTQTVSFRVPPVDKFLNVEISSDSDRYRPGDTGTFSLRVSDATGAGVRAQVTLGLVDEAIYLIRPESAPDIRGFFYALRGNAVGTRTSAWYYFGGAQALERGMPAAAPMMEAEAMDMASEPDMAEPELREDFRDTILWLPYLETDQDGLATITVTFPDNLTEWRLTARAITLGDEVGQETYSVVTTLPVIARLAAPRFLIRGDEAALRVIGQNNLETDLEGRLEFMAEGLSLKNPEPQRVSLPAGGRATAEFSVRADTTGTASLTAQALTPEASDALRIPLPILPHGVREEVGWAGSGSTSWTFVLPSDVDLGVTRGSLYLTPSLAAAVSPALSYLAGFPYGCTEQTMSRFLPSVLAARAGDLAQLPDEVAENLDEMVEAGFKRLYDFQHDDGGWGFWMHDASSPFISAYILSGLLEAQEAGFEVRQEVLERGLSYLEGVIRSGSFASHRVVDADGKAYAYYVLAKAGRSIDGLEGLAGAPDMSPYGLALSVLAFHELGRDVEANLYLDELLSRATVRDRVAYWETGAPRYYWNDDRIEATAYALEALAKLRPDEPIISRVVTWLLLERRGARWVSTKDTAAVVKAALALAEATGEGHMHYDMHYEVSIMLNGRALESRLVEGRSTKSIEIPLEGFYPGPNRLELTVTGEGTLYASAGVSYVAERDYLEPEESGITVSRTYERLAPEMVDNQLTYRRSPINAADAVGDYLLVTVTLEPKDAYRYVIVNEPLPAGYSVVENDHAFRVSGLTPRYGHGYPGWNHHYDGRDIRDERIDFYFSLLTSPVTFSYILRAETPGVFTALPTQAWLMYEPEVRGVGVQTVLGVVP